jgi:hypothetical protein
MAVASVPFSRSRSVRIVSFGCPCAWRSELISGRASSRSDRSAPSEIPSTTPGSTLASVLRSLIGARFSRTKRVTISGVDEVAE